jgi:hypothetical protein
MAGTLGEEGVIIVLLLVLLALLLNNTPSLINTSSLNNTPSILYGSACPVQLIRLSQKCETPCLLSFGDLVLEH